MASLLNSTSQNSRLSELLAGSTAVLSDPAIGDNGIAGATSFVSDDNADNAAQDDAGSAATLAGPDGNAQPVFDDTNIFVKDFHQAIEDTSHNAGAPNLLHGVTDLGETAGLGNTGVVPPTAEGNTNLVTDTVNLPGEIVDGNARGGLDNIVRDGGDTIHAATDLVDAAVSPGDPLNPVPNLINSIGNDLQHTPLATVGSGGIIGTETLGNGLLDGSVGDLTHSSSGHLIDVDAGPQQANGIGLDVLSQGDSSGHSGSVNVIDVGPNGPNLVDATVLNEGPALPLAEGGLPTLTGNGADGLVGGLNAGVGDSLGSNTLLNVDTAATTEPGATALVEVHPDALASSTLDHGLLNTNGSHII